MARKTKKAGTSKTKADDASESVKDKLAKTPPETIEDAEIIEDIAAAEPDPEPEQPEETSDAKVEGPATGDMEEMPAGTADPVTPEEGEPTTLEDTPEAKAEAKVAPEPTPQPAPTTIRKGGFVPMLLGGVAAAAIGFGAALYVFPQDDTFEQATADRFAAQDKALAEVKSAIPVMPDISPLGSRIAALEQALGSVTAGLQSATARLDGLETRLTELEKRPVAAAAPAAVAAYQNELKALQQAVATQRAEIEKLAAEATLKEENAEITAQKAMIRAALSRIQTALDTGTGYADAADTLATAGIALPNALAANADTGIATRAALAESFPAAARAALAVARKAESGGGLGGFLANQLGARSLEPREGDDADAVLSRAEAAVREGRISDAVAELATLPEQARAEMSDWLATAQARLDALAAAEQLAAQMN